MRLGTLSLKSNLVLAPLSGIYDYPFQQNAKEHGCSLVVTEMVSAEGLLRKGESFLKIGEDEHPVTVQLFGSNAEVLGEAAQMAESMGADMIDINMGCPAKQVVETGAGVDLMRFPEKVEKILTTVRREVKCPLSIKIRSGWDGEHINAVEISKIAEDHGADAIFIHPRTKVQGFHGRADWSLIREVKNAIHVPVVGNGDVTTQFLAKRMLEETGCDGVMIARGALGNPFIFSQIATYLLTGECQTEPSEADKISMARLHARLMAEQFGEERGAIMMRRYLGWYVKGFPGATDLRPQLFSVNTVSDIDRVFAVYSERVLQVDSNNVQ